jgi:hypothetical protein
MEGAMRCREQQWFRMKSLGWLGGAQVRFRSLQEIYRTLIMTVSII